MKIGNIEVYGVIYKITNIINGKCYIGQTTIGIKKRYNNAGVGVERIYRYYKNSEKKSNYCNEHLLRAFEKYGIENFELIENYDIAFSKDELDIKEKCYIKQYDAMKNGYNYQEGGSNGKMSEETIRKMKIAHTGKKQSEESKKKRSKTLMGHKVSDETRQKQRERALGREDSEETKRKKSEHHAFKGKKRPEHSKKMSGGNNPNAKSVICLTTLEIFNSCSEGAKKYNIKNSCNIANCCRKYVYPNGRKVKSAGKLQDGTKLVWRYLNWKHNKKYRVKGGVFNE